MPNFCGQKVRRKSEKRCNWKRVGCGEMNTAVWSGMEQDHYSQTAPPAVEVEPCVNGAMFLPHRGDLCYRNT